VKVKEIDAFNAKALKGFVTATDDIVGCVINGAGIGLVRRAIDTALRGNFKLLACAFIQPGKKVTDQPFIVTAAIQICGINETSRSVQ
jgi:hypothetical protein